MKLRHNALKYGAALTGLGLVLTACTSDPDPSETASVEYGPVEIVGAFGGDQAAGFQTELAAASAATGVQVTYAQLEDFETAVIARVEGGDAPDIALFPQPGLLMNLSADMIPLNELIDVDAVAGTLVPGWDTLAVEGDDLYGLPVGANVKSIVWYNPAAFTAAGYEVPTSDAELTALTAQIREDATGYPWCIGIESGGATGWAATDWLEEYVLRIGGIDLYNQWWKHEIPFNHPTVLEAGQKFEEIALTEGNVAGGGAGIAAESFGTAGNGLFVEGGKAAGQCFMMRQGSFITDFFPDDIKAELAADDYSHVGTFPLPAPEGATDAVLGGGDLAAAFNDKPETKLVLEYILSDKLGANGWAATGFFLSPHSTFDNTLYPTAIQQAIGEQLSSAALFGFDASDLMPGEIGTDAEWRILTEWISTEGDLEQALADIEAAWPAG